MSSALAPFRDRGFVAPRGIGYDRHVDFGLANAGHATVSALIMPDVGLFEGCNPNATKPVTTGPPRHASARH